jgi:preprotein translocase subunit SecD
LSCAIGLGLVLVFSVFYYKLSGLLAFFALVYNLLLIIIGLSLLKATLTLPGIAGMVLTVGMAIDASILIYEKIKESLASGASVRNAVNEGFSDAVAVILDSNITTFIVGVVLFYFGTGPIKGFAVTMMIGIISTLITGLFFLRSMFNYILGIKEVQKLSI